MTSGLDPGRGIAALHALSDSFTQRRPLVQGTNACRIEQTSRQDKGLEGGGEWDRVGNRRLQRWRVDLIVGCSSSG